MSEEYDCIIKYHNYIKEISFIFNVQSLSASNNPKVVVFVISVRNSTLNY